VSERKRRGRRSSGDEEEGSSAAAAAAMAPGGGMCCVSAVRGVIGEEASCGSPAVRSAADGSDDNLFIFL
jgi:hypothetical protein